MKRAHTYLMFPGTCRAAMEFHADVLDGEVTVLQTMAEAHGGKQLRRLPGH